MAGADGPFSKRFWIDSIDARIPALFRLAMGAVLLWDLIDRLGNFHASLSPAGIYPLSAVNRWSLFTLATSLLWTKALYAAGMLAALCYWIGYRTRAASIATFVFLVSLHHRNPIVLNGADTVLRLMIGWSMFLDQGAQFSVDVWLGRRPRLERVAGFPVRSLQLQVAIVYLGAAISKFGGHWFDGSAVYLALQSPTFTRPTAAWLLGAPGLCMALTYFTLVVELGFPVLVFVPLRYPFNRVIALVAGCLLHLGIFSVMRVGLFSLVMIATYPLFLPTEIWTTRATDSGGSAPAEVGLARWPAAVMVLHVVLSLFLFVSALSGYSFRTGFERYASQIGLHQDWSMFFQPPIYQLRWAALGTRSDGVRVDVMAVAAPALGESYGWWSSAWTGLQSGLANKRGNLRYIGPFLCRRYAVENSGQTLVALEIYLTLRQSAQPGGLPSTPETQLALTQPCRADAPPLSAAPSSELLLSTEDAP